MKQIFLDILNRLRAINTITVTNGGAGYSSAPTVTISAPNASGGIQATAQALLTGGVVTKIIITNPGSGYGIPGPNGSYPIVTITGGSPTTPAAATATTYASFQLNGENRNAFIAVWNDQLKDSENGKIYDYTKPAIFVEFVTSEVIVLGQGVESFDPFDIRVHIIDDMIDAGDGTMEQNLRIFDFKQQVYSALKMFEPTGCVKLFRLHEEQDTNHNNLYHYIQVYRTNWVDSSMVVPVNGIVTTPPTPLTVTPSFAN